MTILSDLVYRLINKQMVYRKLNAGFNKYKIHNAIREELFINLNNDYLTVL